MTSDRFIDLDELVLLCDGKHGRQYIAESVACYRAGAFRACIVAAWIAVVFDFVAKLQQLELSGDAKAKQVREAYDRAQAAGDTKACLEFERGMLALARDEFELISSMECEDLERLVADRNRCAHPSMKASEEAYAPSAETARAHLRNVVEHLLRHPPVQGKAALARIQAEVDSTYFPTSTDDAAVQLSNGPLARPRKSLVRSLVTAFVKTLLREPLDPGIFKRRTAALNGTRKLHRETTDAVLAEWMNRIVRDLPPDRIPEVVMFLKHVPDVWCFCDESVRKMMERVVDQLPESGVSRYLTAALDIEPLKTCAVKRVKTTTGAELCALVDAGPRPEYSELVVAFYKAAPDEATASLYGARLVIPMVPLFAEAQLEQVLACTTNEAVRSSTTLGAVLRTIRDTQRVDGVRFAAVLKANELHVTFKWLIDESEGEPDSSEADPEESEQQDE